MKTSIPYDKILTPNELGEYAGLMQAVHVSEHTTDLDEIKLKMMDELIERRSNFWDTDNYLIHTNDNENFREPFVIYTKEQETGAGIEPVDTFWTLWEAQFAMLELENQNKI